MRLTLTDFSKGLWLVSGKETALPGFFRRLRGAHELRTPSLRSRAGSSRIHTTDDIRTITKYNGHRYMVGFPNVLYDNGTSIYTSVVNLYPQFLKMSPQPGVVDYLFFTDSGGVPKKVSPSNVVQNWGIGSTPNAPAPADNGAGAMAAGTYSYAVVFKNNTTGSRGNVSGSAPVTIIANRQVRLTLIPTSTDSQVTAREIYRTTANGSRFFRVTTINDNTTTTFNDNTTDAALQSFELQFDNVPPTDFAFNDVWEGVNRHVWWIDSVAANAGRAYYSPPGRPESVRGFIEVSGTDEFLVKGFSWNGGNWVFSTSRLYRILGDQEPFRAVPVDGVPGLVGRRSLCITPYGIAFLSYDGMYLFNGSHAELLGFDEIAPLFRGENVENLVLIDPTTSPPPLLCAARNQVYLVTDTQTIVFDLQARTWRDLGLGLLTAYKEPNSRDLIASFNNDVYILETPTTTTDQGASITIEWEMGGALSDIAHVGTIQRVYFDIMTTGESVTASLIADGISSTIGTLSTASRSLLEFPVGKQARVFSIRLTGTVADRVELFGLAVDVKIEGSNKELGIG